MTFLEAFVLEQPNEIIKLEVAICRPDAIRCQIFSYFDIGRFNYQHAAKNGTKFPQKQKPRRKRPAGLLFCG